MKRKNQHGRRGVKAPITDHERACAWRLGYVAGHRDALKAERGEMANIAQVRTLKQMRALLQDRAARPVPTQ